MGLSRRLSLGGRLILGLLLTGALVYVTHLDLQDPSKAWLRPFVLYLLGLISILSALLIQSFARRFNVFEVLVNTAIVLVLGCLLFPPMIPDHSRRKNRAAPISKPDAVSVTNKQPP
jgi:cytochrome bd-type quinol oxidase subunit 2